MKIELIRSDEFGDLYVDYYEETRISIRIYTDGSVTCSSPRIDVLNQYLKSEQYKEVIQTLIRFPKKQKY